MTDMNSRVAEKLDLIEAVLKGYGASMAKEDALQTLRSLRADLQKATGELPSLNVEISDAYFEKHLATLADKHPANLVRQLAKKLLATQKPALYTSVTGQTFWLYELTKGEGIYQGCTGENAESVCRQVAKDCSDSGEPFMVTLPGQTKSILHEPITDTDVMRILDRVDGIVSEKELRGILLVANQELQGQVKSAQEKITNDQIISAAHSVGVSTIGREWDLCCVARAAIRISKGEQ